MQNTNNIEKLLLETPVPSVQDGPHRTALKQELLTAMETHDTFAADRISRIPGKPALSRRWVIAAVAATAVVATIVLIERTAVRVDVAPSGLRTDRVTTGAPEKTSVASSAAPERESMTETLEQRPLKEKLGRTRLSRQSLDQSVADAQVIVVATALDSTPAPPHVQGDLPESMIRF